MRSTTISLGKSVAILASPSPRDSDGWIDFYPMHYADGQTIEPGDIIQIDGKYRGRVLASMDTNSYLPGAEYWGYLPEGIMVDTDFAGLVHYTTDATDELALVERPGNP